MPGDLPAKPTPQPLITTPAAWGLILWLASGIAFPPAGLAESARDLGGYPGYTGPGYRGYTTEALYVSAQDGTRLAIDVHLPKGLPADAKIPTVMQMTRYWRAISLRWPASLFNRDDIPEGFDITIDTISLHTYREAAERSGAAYYLWGSWLDAGTANAVLRHFFTYSNPQRAVIGAWSHGARADADPFKSVDAPLEPSKSDQMLDCLRFLDHYLKDIDNGVMSDKLLHYYTAGEGRWKTTGVWPPEGNPVITVERNLVHASYLEVPVVGWQSD